MMTFPEWFKHEKSLHAGRDSVFLFQLDHDGRIIDFSGNHDDFLSTLPERGRLIHDLYPLFEGIFPLKYNQIRLPNIETMKGVLSQVEIIKEEDYIITILEDTTHHLVKEKEVDFDKDDLIHRQKKDPPSDASYHELFSTFLYHLDVGVFRYDCKGKVIYTGRQPNWLFELKPRLKTGHRVDITDVFPFLEVFLPEFEMQCKTHQEIKFPSDLWTETDSDNNERLLQCIGVMKNQTAWLLIVSHDTVLTRNRDVLQKAREQKLFTEKLEKAKDELQKLLKFKDQFVSVVSHDLRSPISSVVGVTNLMLMDEEFMERAGEVYADLIKDVNNDMKLLIDYNEKLYLWSNIQLGKFTLEPKKLDLLSLFQSTRNRFLEKAKEKEIEILIEQEEDYIFEADESLFVQVLTNLVGNALKFTPHKGKIVLGSKKKENKIIVFTMDTGVGIKPEVAKNLFSGYVKEHESGTDGEKGTGLGLGICKRILDAHGFGIDVNSKLGEGTEFLITIPPYQE